MTDTLDLTRLPSLGTLGPDKLKLLLHGSAGTGKTSLAASVAELGKTLYIDLLGQAGLDSIATVPYADNIVPFRPESVEQLNEVFWQVQGGDHDFVAVVIEHVSTLHHMYVRYHDGLVEAGPRKAVRGPQKPKKRDGRQLYGEANDSLKDDVLFWYALADSTAAKPVHVVMTSHTRERESREGAEDWRIGPDVSPGAIRTVEATPNYIGYCAIERKGGGELSLADLAGEESLPEDYVYTVRFGPHDGIMTKTHEAIDAARRWPSVVGRDGKRLTLPKFMRFLGLA